MIKSRLGVFITRSDEQLASVHESIHLRAYCVLEQAESLGTSWARRSEPQTLLYEEDESCTGNKASLYSLRFAFVPWMSLECWFESRQSELRW
jgi:hypothetical protein